MHAGSLYNSHSSVQDLHEQDNTWDIRARSSRKIRTPWSFQDGSHQRRKGYREHNTRLHCPCVECSGVWWDGNNRSKREPSCHEPPGLQRWDCPKPDREVGNRNSWAIRGPLGIGWLDFAIHPRVYWQYCWESGGSCVDADCRPR